MMSLPTKGLHVDRATVSVLKQRQNLFLILKDLHITRKFRWKVTRKLIFNRVSNTEGPCPDTIVKVSETNVTRVVLFLKWLKY